MKQVAFDSHPIAEIFPLLPDAELRALADDIKANGLRHPILLCDGKILDGRNRYHACALVNVEPRFEEYDGKDPLGVVVSLNLRRRNLNESQRSMIGARLAKGKHGGNRKKQGPNLAFDLTEAQAAELLNVSESNIKDAKAILRDAPEEVAAIEAGEKSVFEVKRALHKKRVSARVAKMPTDKFRVLYADPPWQYGDTMAGLEGWYGPAANHYPTMSLADLGALSIAELCEPDAVLFLWVTVPLVREGLQLLSAWGFEYKTHFVWDKVKHNVGHYSSVRHELLFLATRGSCVPDVPKLFDSVQSVERSEKHSEKPEEFRTIIETLYPHGRRLELFARGPHSGWQVWGKEA